MTGGYLVLEDGTTFEGQLFGAEAEKAGEVVFLTGGVDGYQEIITDPSNKGKIIVFTYPLIGNYGVADEFNESDKVQVSGIVVRELCIEPSHYYNGTLLGDFMAEKGAIGISGVDTRELTLKIRKDGVMKGKIVKEGTAIKAVVKELKGDKIDDSVKDVSPKDIIRIDSGRDLTVAVIDCGAGCGFFEALGKRFNVIRCPYNVRADEILGSGAKGVIVSSGPGCPAADELFITMDTIKTLSDKLPIMGVSLGSELVAMAMGAKVEKMKVGHHGSNQPVKISGRICMTSQSQGYCLVPDSMEAAGLEVTQTNLNDNVIEGFKHSKLPVYGYEYRPEGGTGQGDTVFLYDDFLNVIKGGSQ
ncbi:MAG: carbamoyl phosphate synthase small subunit [Candidatus Methanomethylophilaceae archaeon]|nr:carbamoyl phosphate synthase small subunit [Candidatus Methanomethylophilaceae archaeon]